MNILSIETSCDETAAAIIKWHGGTATVIANVVSSQASLHAKWGGVVPDLASREHIKNIVPVIEETLKRASMSPDDIDLIAVTEGPGLMPALLIGVSAAKTLALVWKKPLIGINHLEGHIYANFVGKPPFVIPAEAGIQVPQSFLDPRVKPEDDKETGSTNYQFPLIALIVSGGHTQLMLMREHLQYELLGETQDDAAGEAFDKVAKMLGLPYPGGPIVAARADAYRNNQEPKSNNQEKNTNYRVIPAKAGIQVPQSFLDPRVPGCALRASKPEDDKKKNLFPRPMLESDNYDFSFSGLKTSVLYFLKKHGWDTSAKGGSASGRDESFIDMVCHEFQEAVVDVLVGKTRRALEEYPAKTFVIAGGVSANTRLRERLAQTIDTLNLEVSLPSERIAFLTPEFIYSLDNAAMIGVAAAYRYEHMSPAERESLMTTYLTLDPDANLPLR